MVRDFQSVIGREAREQLLAATGRLPDYAVACVGGGSNAIGLFHAFYADPVEFVGVEAAGEGLDTARPPARPGAGGAGAPPLPALPGGGGEEGCGGGGGGGGGRPAVTGS